MYITEEKRFEVAVNMTIHIWGFVAILLVMGVMAAVAAVVFGKKYKQIGIRKNKLICVCFTVMSCVCVVTAIQLMLMFHNVLFAA